MNLLKSIQEFFHRIVIRFKKQSISVISASISADGSLIHIRYTLTRPDKIKGEEKIFLIDEGTNLNLEVAGVTKNGMLRKKHSANRILLFNNKNNRVHHGSLVTLIFGDIKIEHIKIN